MAFSGAVLPAPSSTTPPSTAVKSVNFHGISEPHTQYMQHTHKRVDSHRFASSRESWTHLLEDLYKASSFPHSVIVCLSVLWCPLKTGWCLQLFLSPYKMCASVSRGSFVCRVGDQGKLHPLDPWRGSVLPVILTRLLHPHGLHVWLRMPVCLFFRGNSFWLLYECCSQKDHEWNLLNSQFLLFGK